MRICRFFGQEKLFLLRVFSGKTECDVYAEFGFEEGDMAYLPGGSQPCVGGAFACLFLALKDFSALSREFPVVSTF